MSEEHEHRKRRGSPEELISNWREYDGPAGNIANELLEQQRRNILLRVKMQGCCGHPGEPGC